MGQPSEDPSRTGRLEHAIHAARGGSDSALGQLLDHYHGYLLHIAKSELPGALKGQIAPSDLVQETCVEAGRGFPAFEGSTEVELRTWLRQIMLHNLQDLNRRFFCTSKRGDARDAQLTASDSKGQILANLACQQPSPSQAALSAETRQAVVPALTLLPDDYQTIVRLRNTELLSFAQIGHEMRRSSEAARKLWVRAVEMLAQILSSDDSSTGSLR